MIIDHIKNASTYKGLTGGIQKALDYLARTDFSALAPGRYDIEGDRVYALVQHYNTRPREKGLWEAHRRYIDVQFVSNGLESMGYAPLDTMTVTQPYAADKDCVLFSGNGDFVTATSGTFVIFFPQDVHMPCLACGAPQPMLKVVVKVAVD
jgi:YhcH/YjgK/YiaL family protein